MPPTKSTPPAAEPEDTVSTPVDPIALRLDALRLAQVNWPGVSLGALLDNAKRMESWLRTGEDETES